MQAFSDMQRSFTYKEVIGGILALLLLTVYESISSILYLLPPLIGAAFYMFTDFADRKQFFKLSLVILFLFIIEADKSFMFGTLLLYFTLAYFIFVPYIKTVVSSQITYKIVLVLLTYVGYFLFLGILGFFLKESLFNLSWILLYYAVFETFLVVFLL